MEVVLVEPEIPQNTGNISRTCVMTGTPLHLVKPLGFSLDESRVRRAGLDYWPYLKLRVHENFTELRRFLAGRRFLFFSTRGGSLYTEIDYHGEDVLVFGSETKGLPAGLLAEGETLRIPMVEAIPRSLNLSNSVAVVLYEALRQQGFPGLC